MNDLENAVPNVTIVVDRNNYKYKFLGIYEDYMMIYDRDRKRTFSVHKDNWANYQSLEQKLTD